jgi:hypothetical protein
MFFSGYAEHRMRCSADNSGKVRDVAFTTTNLEVVLMSGEDEAGPLSEILANPGFRNIAKAVRLGTINAQYKRKQKKLPSGIDVHFGLSHDLRRTAPYKAQFVSAMCNYLNIYNLENLRVHSRDEKPGRLNVETSDIEQFMKLVDVYGSELVAGLLLAYGYARNPREDPETSDGDAVDDASASPTSNADNNREDIGTLE